MIKRLLALLLISCSIFTIFANYIPASLVYADDKTAFNTLSEASEYSKYISNYTPESNLAKEFSIYATSAVCFGGAYYTEHEGGINCINYKDEYGYSEWNFVCENEGYYNLAFTYLPLKGRGNSIEISIELDGSYPYNELKEVMLPRWFENVGGESVSGNTVVPNQQEVFDWYTQYITDSVGLINEPLKIYLTEGEHILKITDNEETFLLSSIKFSVPNEIPTYKEVSSDYKSEGKGLISIEGENAYLKTGSSLVPKSDSTSASLSPADSAVEKINYIGSTNWEAPGETLIWKFTVEESGLYSLGYRYRQNYVLNGISYRSLKIDGETPFKEASAMAFKYAPNWQYDVFSDEENKPYMFYLEKGEHELSMSVTMGPMAEINYDLLNVTSTLGSLYRKIVMITGENPDSNRDYDLFGQISGMEETLTKSVDTLKSIADRITAITGNKSDSNVSVIKNMAAVLQRMLDKPYFATDYKSDYYNNYCSMSSIVYEMRKMALDIDEFILYTEENEPKDTMAGFFKQLGFDCMRFMLSFVQDYSTFGNSKDEQVNISLWVNWGRDQAQVLNNLIAETFTSKYNIGVQVKIVNASMIQAVLADNGPDLSLRLARSQPVNLAMRDAVYDLTKFDDYDEVIGRFMNGAEIPYTYNSGVYALPDTQQFYMLFYRKDIFEELGVKVPTTWDGFLNVATVISRSNMYVGVPYVSDAAQSTSGVGAVSLFPTILLQNGGSIYDENKTQTVLSEPVALRSFEFWSEFYTNYKFPVTYNFFNRFRSGEMPMGIAPYVQYTTLNVAAPEIAGLWGMAAIPGTKMSDGAINNTETGGGTGSVILSNSKHKEEAWEFLKWWTSSETQVKYSNNLESILGAVERQATANVDALRQLSWSREDTKTLIDQWEKVEEIPEIPGGYYTVRAIDQAFWDVYNNGANPSDTLISWSETVDAEIIRKRNEYGLK